MSKPSQEHRVRVEWVIIGVLTLVGGLIRLSGLGRAGLTHFDEGIYALAGGWVLQSDGLRAIDAGLIAYAPPLYTILVGLAYRFLGASDISAILASILTATASIPVVGWIGRRTFGPGAGAAAAAFAAFSIPHVVFSRMALTDSTFLLAWLLAWGAGLLFLERPGLIRALGMGLSVGLAQLTKYNGWLFGGIVATTALVALLFNRDQRTRHSILRTFGLGILGAVLSALIYLPWYRFVERNGGYAKLLEHQRSYLGTLSSWPGHQLIQWEQETALSGGRGWTVLAVAVATGLAWLIVRPQPAVRRVPALVVALIGLGFVPHAGWFACAAGFAWLVRSKSAPARLLAIAWLIPAVLTPFYHPYARLWLPLQGAGWLALGGLVGQVARYAATREITIPPARLWMAILAGSGVVALVIGIALGVRPLPDVLGPTDELHRAVIELARAIPQSVGSVRLLARPPVAFYLAGRCASQRLPDLAALDSGLTSETWAVIDELQVLQEPDGAQRLDSVLERWSVVKVEENRPGPATLLDVSPSAARGGLPSRPYRLWLLRSRSAP